MRYDYGLYLVAIICFVLAGFLFMGYAGYIQLTTGNEATDLVITMFSAVLGVIFVGIGYGVKPSIPKMYMAECPKCGSQVANPRKSWKMARKQRLLLWRFYRGFEG